MTLSARDCAKIRKEIDSWRSEALLPDDVSQKLLERYVPGAAGSGHVSTVVTMGAVLIGVGVLLFVGSNWSGLSATLKLAIIIAAMLGSYILGWILRFEPGKHPRVGSGFMLVGSLIYGAGIWLITQMFNLGIDLSQGIVCWGLGVAGIALATRSSGQSVLFALLATGWAVLSEHLWNTSGDGVLLLSLRLLMAFGISTLLAYYLRSKAGIAVSAATTVLGFAALTISEPSQFTLIPFGACLFAFYLAMKREWEAVALAFMYSGSVALIVGLLNATFWYHSWPFLIPGKHLVLVLPAILLSAVVTLMRPQFKWEAAGLALATALPIVALTSPSEGIYRLAMNVVLIAALVATMWSAQGRLRQPGLINLAIAGFVLEVIFRYFDFFFSMFDRSLAFTLGGIILVILGATAERGRRKFLEGMKS